MCYSRFAMSRFFRWREREWYTIRLGSITVGSKAAPPETIKWVGARVRVWLDRKRKKRCIKKEID